MSCSSSRTRLRHDDGGIRSCHTHCALHNSHWTSAILRGTLACSRSLRRRLVLLTHYLRPSHSCYTRITADLCNSAKTAEWAACPLASCARHCYGKKCCASNTFYNSCLRTTCSKSCSFGALLLLTAKPSRPCYLFRVQSHSQPCRHRQPCHSRRVSVHTRCSGCCETVTHDNTWVRHAPKRLCFV